MLKFVDLFSGIGGFHLAFQNKAECILACEYDKNAEKTYKNNFVGNYLFEKDVRNIKILPEHDIICAGFPCQPFSVAGHQKGFAHETQGNLFFNILEITKINQPKVLFLENVKNLKSHDKGKTFKIIIDSLKEIGYNPFYKILNACEYGNVPQNRERIYIVAFKNNVDFKFPEKIELTRKLNQIIDLSDKKSDFYYQTNENSSSIRKMLTEIKEKGFIYQYRRYYVRKNNTGLCPTLTANMGSGGHNVPLLLDNYGVRKLTPEECLGLMGFPKNYKFPEELCVSAKYKQIGNSVPVPVVERIAEQIISTLEKS